MNIRIVVISITLLIALAAVSIGLHAQAPQRAPSQNPPIPRSGIDVGIPDLVASLQTIGPPAVINGSVELPVRVVVKNQGFGRFGNFKVSVEYKRVGFDDAFVVAFDIPGQDNDWYPMVREPLGHDQSVAFKGRLTFDPAVRGERIVLRAVADSCAGEAGPAHCRIRESDERNNKSAPVWVALP
jgi:hypothetical protein